MRCAYPWSVTAPAWPGDTSSAAADRGSRIHRAIEARAKGTRAPAHDDDEGDAAAHAASAITGPGWRHEVTIAYDPTTDTAREIDAPELATEDEIVGTVDALRVVDGCVEIVDWKTGATARSIDPDRSQQLRWYSLAAARALGVERARPSIVALSESGYGTWHGRELDAFDLDEIRDELRDLLRRAPSALPVLGRHCRAHYCPIVASCPAVLAQAKAVLRSVSTMATPTAEPTTDDEARATRIAVRALEAALEKYDNAVKRYVDRNGPLDLGDGTSLAAVEQEGRESIDAGIPGAVSAIREELGDRADEALEVKTSKAAIERAIRARLRESGEIERGAIKAAVDKIDARLRGLGAVRQGAPYMKYEEIRPKKATKRGQEES